MGNGGLRSHALVNKSLEGSGPIAGVVQVGQDTRGKTLSLRVRRELPLGHILR